MIRMSRLAPILGATLLCVTACQSDQQAGGRSAERQTQANAEPTKVDFAFVNTAIPLGLEAVEFAKLAQTKAADPEVRSLATGILADFTAVNPKLAAASQSIGLSPPDETDARHQILYHQLESLSGATFDRAYVNAQLQDLTQTIQAFQTEADTGSNPALRSVSQQYLPIMQEHLATASRIAHL